MRKIIIIARTNWQLRSGNTAWLSQRINPLPIGGLWSLNFQSFNNAYKRQTTSPDLIIALILLSIQLIVLNSRLHVYYLVTINRSSFFKNNFPSIKVAQSIGFCCTYSMIEAPFEIVNKAAAAQE